MRPNLALFLVLIFHVVVYFVMDACLLLLCLFSFFSTKRLSWKNVSNMMHFVWGGTQNLKSVNSNFVCNC